MRTYSIKIRYRVHFNSREQAEKTIKVTASHRDVALFLAGRQTAGEGILADSLQILSVARYA
jgi:hypothetical protein